jgi:predicted ATPase
LAHSPSLAASLAIDARLLSLAEDDAALNGRADELVALSIERGFPLWVALGTIYQGWVRVRDRDVAQGMSLMRDGLATYRATGTELWVPHFFALLAGACEGSGQTEEGLALLDAALEISDRIGERWFAAELCRHKGHLLLRQGYAEAAEEPYRKAMSIARQQEAKLWELRAAASLARLCRDQGRHAEAGDLLGPVYGWFTEGFGTPDLKEAKALLDELCA